MPNATILKEDPSSRDMLFENNNFVLTNDDESLTQKIREKLLLFRGEWFLNEDTGLPFFQLILGQKRIPYPSRKFFIEIITSVEGVSGVSKLSMSFGENRTLEISFIAIKESGEQIQQFIDFGV